MNAGIGSVWMGCEGCGETFLGPADVPFDVVVTDEPHVVVMSYQEQVFHVCVLSEVEL